MKICAYRDTDDQTVDWWFMYKLPSNVHPTRGSAAKFKVTSGWEYLYHDALSSGPLSLSENLLDQKTGALYRTLEQIYDPPAGSDKSLGWICYNDEIPEAKNNDDRKGHSKGVLAFDLESDTAFWLLHSWPRFPDLDTGKPGSRDYGQTFLCITLKNVDAARSIAGQFYHQQEPQTYECRIPKSITSDDILYKVANGVDVNELDPPGDLTLSSRGGQEFRLIAKNRHWNEDFWIDLVGPKLKSNIDVESWRRGAIPDTEDADGAHHTTDTLYINIKPLDVPYEWHYTKDHAKWGISESGDWVCVADINRQKSQEKRGGGAICFRNKDLHDSLAKIEHQKQT